MSSCFVQSSAGLPNSTARPSASSSTFVCRQPLRHSLTVPLNSSVVSVPSKSATIPTAVLDESSPTSSSSTSSTNDPTITPAPTSTSASASSSVPASASSPDVDPDLLAAIQKTIASTDFSEPLPFKDPFEGRDPDDWYAVKKPIERPDVGDQPYFLKGEDEQDEQPVDILSLESAGQKILEHGSYASVVDINVDKGGKLDEDDDNNNLFTGVGFNALLESKVLRRNLKAQFNITTATHVQLAAIPRIQSGHDLVIQSYTGTGKTLAFLLPILDNFHMDDLLYQQREEEIENEQGAGTNTDKESSKKKNDFIVESYTKVMIITPTRELAVQISKECEKLLLNTNVKCQSLIGGANIHRQIEKIKKTTPNIIIGTPGRILEIFDGKALKKNHIQTLIIDEIDECIRKKEFLSDINTIITKYLDKSYHETIQKIFISATSDVNTVRNYSSVMKDPILLRVCGKLKIPGNINHWQCIVPQRLKLETIRKVIFCEKDEWTKLHKCIIFVNQYDRIEILANKLYDLIKLPIGTLKGSDSKMDRKEVLTHFRKGRIQVLVTTEISARGLDIEDITHVINYDLPTDSDHYVHRAGRCGRMGKQGHVVNIATPDMAFVVGKFAKDIAINITRMEPRNGTYAEPLVRERDPNNTRGRPARTDMPQKRADVTAKGVRATERTDMPQKRADVTAKGVRATEKKKVQQTNVSNESNTKKKQPVGTASTKVKTGSSSKAIGEEELNRQIERLQRAVRENDKEFLKKTLGDFETDLNLSDNDIDELNADALFGDDGEEEFYDDDDLIEQGAIPEGKGKATKATGTKATGTVKKKQAKKMSKKDQKKEVKKRNKPARPDLTAEDKLALKEKRREAVMRKRAKRAKPSKRAITEQWVGNRPTSTNKPRPLPTTDDGDASQ